MCSHTAACWTNIGESTAAQWPRDVEAPGPEREMPTSGVTQVGMIMAMSKFRIDSDVNKIIDKAEELEGMISWYEAASSKLLSDNYRQALRQASLLHQYQSTI